MASAQRRAEAMPYPRLLSPFRLKNVELRNRVAISGHHAGWWIDRGMPSAEFVAYIEERARGGVGLFTIGCTSPMPFSGWLENVSDEVIPRYRACVESAHRHGTALFAQLCHPGFGPLPGPPLWGPIPRAASTQPAMRPPARHVMGRDEIAEMVEAFGRAAARAAEGGVNGVELHAHEWFLHAQFLNPAWNLRTDEYGGSMENRVRFVVETLEAMRRAVGSDLVVGIRLKADDVAQRGNDENDYAEIVQRLERAGLVDYVLFTGGDTRHHHGPMGRPEGEWIDLVARQRRRTKLPVMHAGRIVTAAQAEAALEQDAMDIVVMTKSHIADPFFVRKVVEGREEDIRHCTRCLQSCHGAMYRMTCVYNPRTSRELMWHETPPATRRKRVVVIGAGPAGVECALLAHARGHEVIVLERGERAGGQAILGAASPLRETWGRIARFYAAQATKLDVRYGVEAGVESVLALEPDAVVVATGSVPKRARGALTVHEALAQESKEATLVVDREGTMRPWVVVDRLSSLGARVAFATTMAAFAPNTDSMVAEEFVRQFESRGVAFHPHMDLVHRQGDSAILRDIATGEERLLEGIQSIVVAAGSEACSGLADALRGQVTELHVIGDANAPGTMEAATFQGHRLGRLL